MLHVLAGRSQRIRSSLTGVLIVAALSGWAIAPSPARAAAKSKPTVVLVHGAFADASGWSNVIGRLQRRGYPVIAPANPLRSVSGDAAYLKTLLSSIEGPIILVGHSYGGFVMTNAATGNLNVKALVYIAAFAPAERDTVGGLTAHAPGSLLGPETLTIRRFPTPDGQLAPEGYITSSAFRTVFAGDLPKAQTDIMAASQRPAALGTLTEPSGPPAWATIPSWYLVAGTDNTIGTANLRFMAQRIHATTVEVKGASHVVMMSHPRETTKLILAAAGRR